MLIDKTKLPTATKTEQLAIDLYIVCFYIKRKALKIYILNFLVNVQRSLYSLAFTLPSFFFFVRRHVDQQLTLPTRDIQK